MRVIVAQEETPLARDTCPVCRKPVVRMSLLLGQDNEYLHADGTVHRSRERMVVQDVQRMRDELAEARAEARAAKQVSDDQMQALMKLINVDRTPPQQLLNSPLTKQAIDAQLLKIMENAIPPKPVPLTPQQEGYRSGQQDGYSRALVDVRRVIDAALADNRTLGKTATSALKQVLVEVMKMNPREHTAENGPASVVLYEAGNWRAYCEGHGWHGPMRTDQLNAEADLVEHELNTGCRYPRTREDE